MDYEKKLLKQGIGSTELQIRYDEACELIRRQSEALREKEKEIKNLKRALQIMNADEWHTPTTAIEQAERDVEYKPFSKQAQECRENGIQVDDGVFKTTDGLNMLHCLKYNTACSSKVCASERGAEREVGK